MKYKNIYSDTERNALNCKNQKNCCHRKFKIFKNSIALLLIRNNNNFY